MKILILLMALFCGAQALAAGDTPSNGVIVPGSNENDMLLSVGEHLIKQLNDTLKSGDVSDASYGKAFGTHRRTGVSLGDSSLSYLGSIQQLVGSKIQNPTIMTMASSMPQETGTNNDQAKTYFMFLRLQNSSYASAVIFFAIESFAKLSDDRYDVALIPGRFFVGF